jgi:hypothetical protein
MDTRPDLSEKHRTPHGEQDPSRDGSGNWREKHYCNHGYRDVERPLYNTGHVCSSAFRL